MRVATGLPTILLRIAFEQLHDAGRGSRYEAGQADRHAAYVDGVEAVDIFAVVDGLDDALLGDVLGQRQLHDKSVDIGVVVQPLYLLQQGLFGDVVFVANEGRFEAALFAGFHFVGDIGFAAAVVAHQDGGQVRAFASAGYDFGNFGSYFLLYLFRDGFSVN